MTVRGSKQYVTPDDVRAHLATPGAKATRASWAAGRFIVGQPPKNQDNQPFVWWPSEMSARDWVLE